MDASVRRSPMSRPDAGGQGDDAGTSPSDASNGERTGGETDAPRASPSRFLPERPLAAVGPDGVYAYNPHLPGAHRHRGSGHTHAAPDHSDIDPARQERRLRDLGGGHGHDYVWLTAHNFVAPDPGVSGIVHMYGVEVYTSESDQGTTPHVLAFLPDGELASTGDRPFGRWAHPLTGVVERIDEAGGLATLAHPTRYSPHQSEIVNLDDSLWGIEGISRTTDIEQNLEYVDARLSAGKYVCISAGADVHDEDWSLTNGHQLVSSDQQDPSRQHLFEQVARCNFFACTVHDTDFEAIRHPTVEVSDGSIHFEAEEPLDQVEFVGQGGTVYGTEQNERRASYRPSGDERYIRIVARRSPGSAVCLSQPVWLYDRR
jgi:hypothetical protein